jgi:hypothetical protein
LSNGIRPRFPDSRTATAGKGAAAVRASFYAAGGAGGDLRIM